ncbi:hypothetical protein HAX54_014574, partial [Datura stramonium]|nr:hypothetical protein [Datura stramonium]
MTDIDGETKQPPLTFDSFLPPHFHSISEENKDLSDSDSAYSVNLPPYGDTTASSEKTARRLHFSNIDTSVHRSL